MRHKGRPRRYRLRYTKLGRVAYLGHLDLVRHLPRIFRRAGLELFYSLGFHPKPELSFGPALGLGIPSLGELLDVTLVDDVDADDLRRRLARVSLDGIQILSVVRLGDNDRALGRVIGETEYAARLPAGADVAAAIARAAGDEPLLVRRESDRDDGKGLARTTDVRRSLRSVEAIDPVEAERLRALLDWPDGELLRFRVAVSHEGSARPVEVVTALCGADVALDAELARTALWAREGDAHLDPMVLIPLRAPRLQGHPSQRGGVGAPTPPSEPPAMGSDEPSSSSPDAIARAAPAAP